MKYRVIVDVFCDEAEHGHAFAERIVQMVDEVFDTWPERRIGLYTHTSQHPDLPESPSTVGGERGT